MFIAGCGNSKVCTVEVSVFPAAAASAPFAPEIKAKKSAIAPALAAAGRSAPKTRSIEIKVTACLRNFPLYVVPWGRLPGRESRE